MILAAALGLAVSPLFAETFSLPPAPPASPAIGLDPMIVGSIYEPGSPLLARVEQLATGSPEAVKAGILSALQNPKALAIDRAAAATLARLLTDPGEASKALTRPDILAGPLARLLSHGGSNASVLDAAEAAKSDAALSRVFDLGSGRPDLKVSQLPRRLSSLSKSPDGCVERHPHVPGAVIKTIDFTKLRTVDAASAVADREETDARRLAALRLGPRYFGQADWKFIGRFPTGPKYSATHRSVREQVFGDSVEKLIRRRRFGPEEHALAVDFLDRMKAAGIESAGLDASNVLIGHTLAAPETRAYLVGGGPLGSFPETARSFRQAIDDALSAYEARTARRDRFLHPFQFQPKPAELPSVQPLPGGSAYRSAEPAPQAYGYEQAWNLFVRGKQWWRQGEAARSILPLLEQPGVANAVADDMALRRAVDQAAARKAKYKLASDRSIFELWEKLEAIKPLDKSVRRKAAWLNGLFYTIPMLLLFSARFVSTWVPASGLFAVLAVWVLLGVQSARLTRLVKAREELARRRRYRVEDPKSRVAVPAEGQTVESLMDASTSSARAAERRS